MTIAVSFCAWFLVLLLRMCCLAHCCSLPCCRTSCRRHLACATSPAAAPPAGPATVCGSLHLPCKTAQCKEMSTEHARAMAHVVTCACDTSSQQCTLLVTSLCPPATSSSSSSSAAADRAPVMPPPVVGCSRSAAAALHAGVQSAAGRHEVRVWLRRLVKLQPAKQDCVRRVLRMTCRTCWPAAPLAPPRNLSAAASKADPPCAPHVDTGLNCAKLGVHACLTIWHASCHRAQRARTAHQGHWET